MTSLTLLSKVMSDDDIRKKIVGLYSDGEDSNQKVLILITGAQVASIIKGHAGSIICHYYN